IDTLRNFANRYPGVHIELQFMNSGMQIEALRKKRIDVGFVNMPINDPTLIIKTVQQEPMWVAMPKGHPLAHHGRVSLTALTDQHFILLARRSSPGLHDLITAACRNAGFSLMVAHEVDNIIASLTLVTARLDLTFCSPSIQKL